MKISLKKSVWKDLGGSRGFGYKRETMPKFKCGYESGGTERHWINKNLVNRKDNHKTSTITTSCDKISGRADILLPGISDQDLSGATTEKVLDRITN